MKNIFNNNVIMISASGIILITGILVSVLLCDFSWFSRSGSLITAIGIIILTRPSIIGQDILVSVMMDASGKHSNDPEYYRQNNEEIPETVYEDVKSRKAVGIYGPIITIIGTLVWGYADLLNKIFDFVH